ncbi:MAG: hypothetical protein V1846_03630 [Candidatus Komeilibacteria bacterium]
MKPAIMRFLLVVILIISCLTLMPTASMATVFEPDSIVFSAGKGIVGSGLTGDIILKSGKQTVTLTGNETRFYGSYKIDLGIFRPSVNLGAYKNTPFAGIQLQTKYGPLCVVNWLNFSSDELTKTGWHPVFFLGYNRLDFTKGMFTLSGTIKNYVTDKPAYYAGFTIKKNVRRASAQLLYEHNVQTDEVLYQIKFGMKLAADKK